MERKNGHLHVLDHARDNCLLALRRYLDEEHIV
jgi:hypothetical protein